MTDELELWSDCKIKKTTKKFSIVPHGLIVSCFILQIHMYLLNYSNQYREDRISVLFFLICRYEHVGILHMLHMNSNRSDRTPFARERLKKL